MKTATTAKSGKAVNYTAEMEAAIVAASPLNLESAKILGAEIGRSYRSVIAKAKSMGLPYEVKPPATKRIQGKTKAELLIDIEDFFGVKKGLDGLAKAPATALNKLIELLNELELETTE